jgi:hypothetical protein
MLTNDSFKEAFLCFLIKPRLQDAIKRVMLAVLGAFCGVATQAHFTLQPTTLPPQKASFAKERILSCPSPLPPRPFGAILRAPLR